MEENLRNVVQWSKRESGAITYSVSSYQNLYQSYHKMVKSPLKQRIDEARLLNACVKHATDLLTIFKNEQNKNRTAKVVVKEIHPRENFPQHVIIIGDIIYIIASYGLPIYDNNLNDFVVPKGEEKVADLLTWRRRDGELADTIIRHLKNLTNFEQLTQRTTQEAAPKEVTQ